MKRRLFRLFCIFCLILTACGFFAVFIGPYSLDGIDYFNLRYEKNHKIGEVDRTVKIKAAVDQDYIDICSNERDYGIFLEGRSFYEGYEGNPLFYNDCSLYFVRKWTVQERIERFISRASKSFENQFGIKLVLVEIEEWDSESQDAFTLYNELREEISPDDCDIVIGFTGKAVNSTSLGLGEMPSEGYLGNYILLGRYLPKKTSWIAYILNSRHIQCYILTHEMGHIFGAVDLEIPKFSVMDSLGCFFTTHFDEYNKGIILQNKYLPFK